MEYQFRVYERDIDLLLVRLFSEGHPVCKLFYDAISADCSQVRVDKVAQSLHGPFGESDLEIRVNSRGKDIVLLIEDKINAPAQKDQYERYKKRKSSIQNAEVYIILVAPQAYLKTSQADGYPIRVPYEKMMDYFRQSEFSFQLLKKACEKQDGGKIVDERVTAYWKCYREYCHSYNERTGANLRLIEGVDERTSQSQWWEFRTAIPRGHIVHKTDRGFLDLELQGQARYIDQLQELLRKPIAWANTGQAKRISIVPAGKSAALRIEGVGELPVTETFDAKAQNLEYIFDQIRRLNDFATELANQNFVLPQKSV